MENVKGVLYVTYADMVSIIRKNLWKIPHDIDVIIGVPRSGLFAATIISEYLGINITTVDDFISGKIIGGGGRMKPIDYKNVKKVLVIDDTCFNGSAMRIVKDKLSDINGITFIYSVVFLEKSSSANLLDFYMADISGYDMSVFGHALYEWNLFQHYSPILSRCIYDMDGVLCLDPPDERNESAYARYLPVAYPMFIPKEKIGCILTYRLKRWRSETEKWLSDNNVHYGRLLMFNSDSYRDRSKIPPYVYKGEIYKSLDNFALFVESDDEQAKRIAEISGKVVYCVETNKIY